MDRHTGELLARYRAVVSSVGFVTRLIHPDACLRLLTDFLDWGRTGPTVSHQRLLLLRHPEQTQPLYHASERIRSRGRSREQGRDTERRFQPKHTLERHPTFLQTAGQCQCRSETAPSEGIIRILMDCPRRNRDRLSVFTQTNACPAASMPL